MTLVQVLVLSAIAVVGIKFVLSLLNRQVPVISIASTGILALFVGFELWKLGGALLERFVF